MKRRPEDAWSVDELLACDDDFVLCNAVFSRLARVDNAIDVSAYGEEERVITLVWLSLGLVENGGFEYLLGADVPGDPGFVHTAASYRTIGALTAYQPSRTRSRASPRPRRQRSSRRGVGASPRRRGPSAIGSTGSSGTPSPRPGRGWQRSSVRGATPCGRSSPDDSWWRRAGSLTVTARLRRCGQEMRVARLVQ